MEIQRAKTSPPSLNLFRLHAKCVLIQRWVYREQEACTRDLPALCAAATADLPLSLIVMDVDHFKTVNDTHGHQVGDAVLKHVAEVLTTNCKNKGIPYRYGGDEITILLPNYNSGEACAFAERLRVQIGRSPDELPMVTASIGVATFPVPIQNAKELFKAADDAVYRAKENGRNQVCALEANVSSEQQSRPLTRRSLSVYMRSNDRVRRMDESIAAHAGQPFNPSEDASYYVLEKAEKLRISTIEELQELIKKHGDLSQKLARCMVPITAISAGTALSYVLDVTAAKRGLEALRSYFGSLQYSNTAVGYAEDFVETLNLLEP